MNIKKEYDVSFVGMPVADRYDYLKFLHKNGINIRVFGKGWNNYPDIKEIYGGYVSNDEYVKIMNQTKINLSFSKGLLPGKRGGQLKGRVIECGLCKAFLLTEYTDSNVEFFKKHRELTFKTKEELLEKVKYYLQRESERESLAQLAYDSYIKDSSTESLFSAFFSKLAKSKIEGIKKELPKINKNIVQFSEDELLNKEQLIERVKNADYICFNSKNSDVMEQRDYFQAYSLEKSGKDISCCDYYIHSNLIGDYLKFMAKKAFYNIPKKDFSDLIELSQIMVTKNFFLKNLDLFGKFARGKRFDIIEENNTNFVSIPLVRLKKLKETKYDSMKKAFRMQFLDKSFMLFSQKKIFDLFYLGLIAESFVGGKGFIWRYVRDALFSKDNWDRLNNSFVKKD